MRGGLSGFWHWGHHGFMRFSWLRSNKRQTQQSFGFAAHPTPPSTASGNSATPVVTQEGTWDFHLTVNIREEKRKKKGAPQHWGFTT